MAEKIVSPGVFTNEIDQSFIPAALGEIGAVVIGPTVKGPILEPTVVSSYGEYVQKFGELIESGSDKYQYLTSHTAKEYLDAVDFMKRSYESYKEVFEDYHGVISPCSTGVADKGLKSTGSADFNRVWSYMHTPAISLPLLQGENNLPLGVQLIGDKYDDHRFLGIARWLEQKSKEHNE